MTNQTYRVRIGLASGMLVQLLLVCWAILSCSWAVAQDSSGPPVVQESGIPVVHSLEEASRYLRSAEYQFVGVDLEAIVTYWNTDQKLFFVQGGDHPIFVKPPARYFDGSFQPTSGSRVRIVGKLPTSKYHILATDVKIMATEKRMAPLQVHLATLKPGNNWSRFVQIQGTVTATLQFEGHHQAILVDDETRAICLLPFDWKREAPVAVGDQLQCTGVLDWDTYPTGAPRLPMCRVMSWGDIQVISTADSSDQSAPISVENFAQLADLDSGTRVATDGFVSFVSSGNHFLIENASGSLAVDYAGVELIEQGQAVRVTGILNHTQDGDRIQLQTLIKSLLVPTLSVPRVTSASEIVESHSFHGRVSVQGTVTAISKMEPEQQLLLSDGGVNFRVNVSASEEEMAALNLLSGDTVQCEGVVVREGVTEEFPFTLNVNSLHGISVKRLGDSHSNSQIRMRHVWAVITILVVIVLISAIWIAAMRRQVQQKTKHLQGVTAMLNAAYESIGEGVLVADGDDKVACVNSAFTAMAGKSISHGTQTSEFFHQLSETSPTLDGSEFWQLLNQPNESGQTVTAELAGYGNPERRLSGSIGSIRDRDGRMIGKLVTLNDLTVQREHEARQVQSQKMEAVGRLAGGVAHDFNNLLTVISFNIDAARTSMEQMADADAKIINNLQETELAADRASQLVLNLLSYSRDSELELKIVSVNDIVTNVSTLIRRSFESTITIDTILDPEVRTTLADSARIEQVLMNVCLNARSALRGLEGTICISTQTVSNNEERVICLRVEDNGEGMSDEVAQRMCEPFYTTRVFGEGTGLGMSMSYGIVMQHGGRIEYESKQGKGTRIDILLPVDDSSQDVPAMSQQKSTNQKESRPSHSCRVLIVDDENAVRKAMQVMLTHLGCVVTEAGHGREAIQLAAQNEFDFVVLDQNMPDLSGPDVFEELSRQNPSLPVVVCTGYLADGDSGFDAEGRKPNGFIQKPFRVSDLEILCHEFAPHTEVE